MMCDMGFAVKLVFIMDAKATEHILHRHRTGKMKHIDVAHVWLPTEVKSNRLRVRRVKERGQSCGHRDENAQQQNHQKTWDIHGIHLMLKRT